jgi:hypothetical protein
LGSARRSAVVNLRKSAEMAGAAAPALDAKGPAPAMAAVAREAASAKALALASLSASLRVIIVRSPRQDVDFLSLAAAALRELFATLFA